MPKKIDQYRDIIKTTKFHAPIAQLIGMKFSDVQEGKAILDLDVQKDLMNSLGSLQGGVLTIMADAAMGIAFGSLLDDNEHFSTLELKINFLRPITHGHLKAVGSVTQIGKKSGFTECEIWNEENKLVAKASSSLLRWLS
jgi:uncharacterized protein (TIGR00369 family)